MLLSIFLIALGLLILALTYLGALGTLAQNIWDKRTTQGTIILTSIGMYLLVIGSHLIS